MKLEHKNPEQKKEEVRSGIAYGVCLVLLFSMVMMFIYRTIQIDIRANLDQSQLEEIDSMDHAIHDVFSRVEAYLIHISNGYIVKQVLQDETPQLRREVELFFSRLMTESPSRFTPRFDQVRLLDLTGMEQIRVDWLPDNTVKIYQTNQLQDKKDRYYFKKAIPLSHNQVYISPLDLNIEHGKIEVPHKPMIRFVTSVYNNDGKRIGFLIFNYLAQHLFDILEAMNTHPEDRWSLLNEEGYYLYSEDSGKTFGFMFQESDKSFFNDFPSLWDQLSNSKKKIINDSKGIYYPKEIRPFEIFTRLKEIEPRRWTLLMFVPNNSIYIEYKWLNKGVFVLSIIFAPVMVLLGWFLGVSRTRNKWYLKYLIECATQDGLTGLFNSHELLERLHYQINLSKRLGSTLGLVYIDLNDLKRINDTLGHDCGDKMIVAASDSIKNTIRTTDIASRMGGDEFVVIFPQLDRASTKKIIERIESAYVKKGKELFQKELTLSWGLAMWKGESDTAKDLIARADRAMFEMKNRLKKKSAKTGS